MKSLYKKILMVVLILGLVITPLILKPKAEYGGADGMAEDAIIDIDPDYEPWLSNIWEPPSGEIESLLFSAQAALGAGVICYILGYLKGKKRVTDR